MKHVLFAAAFILTSTFVFAQAPMSQQLPAATHRHAADPHKTAMKLSKELGLSSDQESRLEPILADRQSKVAAVRANTALTDTERKQQMKAIHHDSKAQMNAVLSADQLNQLRKIHHERETAKATGL